jgi:hypothetical protein
MKKRAAFRNLLTQRRYETLPDRSYPSINQYPFDTSNARNLEHTSTSQAGTVTRTRRNYEEDHSQNEASEYCGSRVNLDA